MRHNTLSAASAGPQTAPALRADAARNRCRILEAARAIFSEQGIEAPLNEIARRADVGIATLYRRFPTRDSLLTATFAARMTAHADAVGSALAVEDPWVGFCQLVESVCAMQAADQGMRDVLTLTFPHDKRFEAQRTRAYDGSVELIRRAQAQGSLRADFVPQDLILLLMANAGVVEAAGVAAASASRRFVAYLLDGFRAAGDRSTLPDPPTHRQMGLALARHINAFRKARPDDRKGLSRTDPGRARRQPDCSD